VLAGPEGGRPPHHGATELQLCSVFPLVGRGVHTHQAAPNKSKKLKESSAVPAGPLAPQPLVVHRACVWLRACVRECARARWCTAHAPFDLDLPPIPYCLTPTRHPALFFLTYFGFSYARMQVLLLLHHRPHSAGCTIYTLYYIIHCSAIFNALRSAMPSATL
jgi:hypothetical protein